jgi:glycosyltransferase involved in cell wall biosynthesis
MKILMWHGYLLTGSGSNIYTSNIANRWRDAGHDVMLMCQEHHVERLSYVDAFGEFDSDNRSFEARRTGITEASGRVQLIRPYIGNVLPVYVYDEYEGFTAKRFVDLNDDELDFYTQANIVAMITAIEQHEPDAIITGHEVMGPYIALKACEATGTSYLTKLHGSALEYAVKQQPRYKQYAEIGLRGARVVTGGSEYMLEEASSIIPGWRDKAVVVNPGCDVELFQPTDDHDSRELVVGYVGKFLVQKGVHNLLASLGLTGDYPMRTVIVGYGDLDGVLRDLWDALQTEDVSALRSIAAGDGRRRLDDLVTFVNSDGLDASYTRRARDIALEFTGRLDHGPLSKVLPTFDVLVVPSVLAEAFGMVAAEAAACGVLPVVPRHSGIGEAGAAVEQVLGEPGLLSYDPADPIRGIAERIDAIAAIPRPRREEMSRAAVELARERWSWAHVAETLLRYAVS